MAERKYYIRYFIGLTMYFIGIALIIVLLRDHKGWNLLFMGDPLRQDIELTEFTEHHAGWHIMIVVGIVLACIGQAFMISGFWRETVQIRFMLSLIPALPALIGLIVILALDDDSREDFIGTPDRGNWKTVMFIVFCVVMMLVPLFMALLANGPPEKSESESESEPYNKCLQTGESKKNCDELFRSPKPRSRRDSVHYAPLTERSLSVIERTNYVDVDLGPVVGAAAF